MCIIKTEETTKITPEVIVNKATIKSLKILYPKKDEREEKEQRIDKTKRKRIAIAKDSRFKPSHISNHIKCKWSKYPN